MWTALVLSLACAQLVAAQYPRWLRLPAGHGDDTQCYDALVHKHFDVGDVWTSPYSGCKQSRCVREGDNLFLDRHTCPELQKHKYLSLTKAGKLYCRHAVGDRRRQFPDCCPRIVCKHFVDGKLELLPEHMHPQL